MSSPRTAAGRPRHCLWLVLVTAPALAANANDGAPDAEVIVVEGVAEVVTSTRAEVVLEGADLRRQVGSTLGATLDDELGVHNASFGPGVGLPVVRGLTGARVKMLQNGLGSHDASSVSPDHAVAVEPLLAEEIHVVRGSSIIRQGGGAIGGHVEVKDRRVPETMPDNAITGAVELRHGRNPQSHAEVFKLDLGAGFLAAHVDGFLRESGLVDIPGGALDEARVREEFGPDAQFENAQGVLPNSDAESRGGSVGASLVADDGFLGLAINTLSSNYGIPPGGLPPHSDVPGQRNAIQRIRVDMVQGRRDLKGEVRFDGHLVERLKVQLGLIDYRHHETDNRRISTTFRNDVLEGRGELDWRLFDAAPATVGVQWVQREFGAEGFETFVPQSDIDTLGVFAVQRLEFGRLRLELGLRREISEVRPQARDQRIGGFLVVPLPQGLDYSAHSAAFEAEYDLTPAITLRASYSYAERPPDVQELLSLGPHLSTRSFDVGNTALEVERGHIVDTSLRWQAHGWQLELDAYHRRMGGFIYQENLGLLFDIEEQLLRLACVRVDQCVSVFGYQQRDAVFTGYEAQLRIPLPAPAVLDEFELALFTDGVRGYFSEAGAGDIPRLPPRTYGVAFEAATTHWQGGIRLTRAEAQRRSGLNETDSDAYLALNAELSYRFEYIGTREAYAFLRARNLLDDEIRNSTSILRNFMPEAGRNVELGLGMEF